MKVKLHREPDVEAHVETIQQRITACAAEMFHARGGTPGRALDDWLAAERQTIWKPAIELREQPDSFVVEAAVAGVSARELDLRVTPGEVLISAALHHRHHEGGGTPLVCEFEPGELFRRVWFPRPVDPRRVTAEYRDGLLRITAPFAGAPAKVDVQAP